jgi:glutamine amidotransferase-like uncharacterized protein
MRLLAVFGVLFGSLSLAQCEDGTEGLSGDAGAARNAAVYVGRGADEDCVQATASMLEWMGFEVAAIDADFIDHDTMDGFDLVCFPGGNMYEYAELMSSAGKQKIKGFVGGGKAYLGICGGAYFAASEVVWQRQTLPMVSLSLFQGTARGPIDEIVAYPDYGICAVEPVVSTHPITQSLPDTMWVLYYWGPSLEPEDTEAIAILAEYSDVDLPAVLAFEFGEGRVFLIGAHPEFEEGSDRDGVEFADELDDKGSDWEFMRAAVSWALRE